MAAMHAHTHITYIHTYTQQYTKRFVVLHTYIQAAVHEAFCCAAACDLLYDANKYTRRDEGENGLACEHEKQSTYILIDTTIVFFCNLHMQLVYWWYQGKVLRLNVRASCNLVCVI